MSATAAEGATEQALTFPCAGDALVGILHRPVAGQGAAPRRGVLMVVGGGPQYRAGGHRQLTLWSRALCADGYPVLRFDYRGMGDSHGDFRGFLDADDDIGGAIDRLFAEVPGLEEVALWGECDAASAILLYAHRDPRVRGLVLLNPWVRTDTVAAKAILRFYYLHRLMQPSFWQKLGSGKFKPLASLQSAWRLVQQSRTASSTATPAATAAAAASASSVGSPIPRSLALPEALLLGLQRFKGPVMLVLSGRDLIAREFDMLISGSPPWQQAMAQRAVQRHDMAEADHTFSSALQRNQVVRWGLDWLRGW